MSMLSREDLQGRSMKRFGGQQVNVTIYSPRSFLLPSIAALIGVLVVVALLVVIKVL